MNNIFDVELPAFSDCIKAHIQIHSGLNMRVFLFRPVDV